MSYNVLSLFAIPVIKIEFKNHFKYQFDEVERLDRTPYEWAVSVNSSFPNIKDDDYFISPEIRDSLMSDLKEEIQNTFDELNIPKKFYFEEFWYNIYHENQGQEAHCHLPFANGRLPYWSGIYYNKNTSPTKFVRPDRMYITQLFEGYQDSAIRNHYYHVFYPDVKDGDILLFPPYLEHFVDSDDSRKDNMRVTFAFNIVPEN